MIGKTLKAASYILLLFCLLLPYSVAAQEFEIPEQARQMVPESDMVEMIGHMTRWKSADLYAHLEATDKILTPLLSDIRDVLGPETSLPDVAAIRREYEAKMEAIYQSATVAEAENRVKELIQSSESLRTEFQNIAKQMQTMAAPLEKKGTELEQELPAKIEAWAQAEEQRIRQQIDEENEVEKAALQARMEQQAMAIAQSLAGAAGENADPGAIKGQVDAAMAPIIAQAGKELQEKMMQRGKELEQEMLQAVEQKADELSNGLFSKLTRIRDNCQDVGQRIEELSQRKIPSYDVYYQKFLEKKREITGKAVEAQLAPAEETILSFADELDIGRSEGRDLPSADELLLRLGEDKQELVAQIMQAESDAEIDEAVNQFKTSWEDTRRSLEAARVKGAQEIIDETRARLKQNDVEAKLREALEDITKGIEDIEKAKRQGEIDSHTEKRLKQLNHLLPQIQEGLALIDELSQAQPTEDIDVLLKQKDRLQEKLESIQRCYEEESFFRGSGTFIEAENETSAILLPRTKPWHSNKEVNATWRPRPSGGSDWYLSRGGETLTYSFIVPEDGVYTLWIRDLATSDKVGQRAITVTIDGVEYGSFAENPDAAPEPGAYGWHKTATASLKTGGHTLEITKTATTPGAAILDCFYFTSDPNEIPE